MRTNLGAALGLTSADALPAAWWRDAAILHCEGYTLYKAAMAEAAMRTAKHHGLQVSLDLASFELVHNCGDALARVLREGLVDVVFCNEEEACAVLQLPQLGGDAQDATHASNGKHVNGSADAKVCALVTHALLIVNAGAASTRRASAALSGGGGFEGRQGVQCPQPQWRGWHLTRMHGAGALHVLVCQPAT